MDNNILLLIHSKTVEDSNSSPKPGEVENGNKTNEEKDERKKIEPAGNCYWFVDNTATTHFH